MYSPRIRKDLLFMLQEIKEAKQEPLATIVDSILRPQVLDLYNQFLSKGSYAEQMNIFQLQEPRRQPEPSIISSPADIYRLCRDMTGLVQERVDVLLLNTKNHVTARKTIFLGTLNASLMHPREVFAPAIEHRASDIVLVHNHPSGNPEASAEDIRATKELVKTGRLVQIPLLDHVIIGYGYCSLKELGHI